MEIMERFELAITALLVVLVMICVYIAVTWTMWRKEKTKTRVEEWLENNHEEGSAFKKGFVPEGQEGLPKITITPVQPRPDISEASPPVTDIDDDVEGYEAQDIDLGRLYFALQYDHQRSMLLVRLIRGEDIPMERDISATYVGVRLLPLRLIGEQVQPHATSINVSFQEVYEFHIPQSDLAHQTLDFHICRYDRFSRKVSIGDVFLALAELSAQGIDITKEVYLCRNLIHSREAHYSDQEYGSEGEQGVPRTTVSKSSHEKLKAKSLWKIVQAAVLQGKFRAISQSIGGQDTAPFYWESMFSSGEGENAESGPGKMAAMLYYSSYPGPPEEAQPQQEDEDEDVDVEEVVRKGERSGSFLFPSQKSDEGDEVEDEAVEPVPPSPLQISPAPEEYYRLVPFTPYTPASPHKNQKPKDSNVSWHVPETCTTRGQDVVQALSDLYSDPRIVTTANLRQTGGRTSRLRTQTTSTDSDRGRCAKGGTGDHSRTKKRKRQEERKMASPPKAERKVTRTVKRHMRKRSAGKKVDSKKTTGQDVDNHTETHKQHIGKHVFRIKPQKPPTSSSSSEEEQEVKPKKKGQKQTYVKRKPGATRESPLVFEAKDFSASCDTYPMKDRAQSAPNILTKESPRGPRKGDKRTGTRPSVSMSDVRDSHIDSSDVSSDFEQYE